MTSDERNPTDESADSGKLETAAGTALAVGAGIAATSGTATAQDTEDVVIKARDYYPNEEFVVLASYEERNRVEFLEEYDDGEDAFDDHDDWDVYSILVEVGEPAGELGIMMIENDVDPNPGDRGTMGASPSFWDTEWDLLEVEVTFDEVDDEEDDAVDDEEDDAVDDEEEDDEVDDDEVDDEEDDEEDDAVDDEEEDDEDDGLLG